MVLNFTHYAILPPCLFFLESNALIMLCIALIVIGVFGAYTRCIPIPKKRRSHVFTSCEDCSGRPTRAALPLGWFVSSSNQPPGKNVVRGAVHRPRTRSRFQAVLWCLTSFYVLYSGARISSFQPDCKCNRIKYRSAVYFFEL